MVRRGRHGAGKGLDMDPLRSLSSGELKMRKTGRTVAPRSVERSETHHLWITVVTESSDPELVDYLPLELPPCHMWFAVRQD
jgi:hypothetical protein